MNDILMQNHAQRRRSRVISGISLFAAASLPAAAQTPSNEQLYQMLLELKSQQRCLIDENAAAKAENAKIRSELAEAKRKLARTATELRDTPEHAPGAPQQRQAAPVPSSRQVEERRELSAVSAPNLKLEGAMTTKDQGPSKTGSNSQLGGYGAGFFTFPVGDKFRVAVDAVLV